MKILTVNINKRVAQVRLLSPTILQNTWPSIIVSFLWILMIAEI